MRSFGLFLPLMLACSAPAGNQPREAGAGADAAATADHPPGRPADAAHPADHLVGGDTDEPPEDGPVPFRPASAEAVALAGQLHGAYLELECMSEEIEFQYCIPRDRGIKNLMLRFGGEAGRTYAVTLRVYGVVEAITYRDGTKAGPHFYVGGRSGTAKTALYGLTVGPVTYHLNHLEIGAGDHYTYSIEYETPPIAIPGASTLVLFVRDPDNFVNTNHMASEVMFPPPGLVPRLERMMSRPLQTQFVYLEVGQVTPMP